MDGGYLDDFEKALFGRDFHDPVNGYRKHLDVDSFIDFHWLVEVAKNADGYWFSQYMHKERGGKLTMGPVWDWDNAFSNPFFRNIWKTNGWRFEVAADPITPGIGGSLRIRIFSSVMLTDGAN